MLPVDPVPLLFDEAWYRSAYPDVAASGMSALDHWRSFGYHEGRQPNFYFEPRWYLEKNPDVVASGLHPLLHYTLFGEAEGRKPSPFFNPAWYRSVFALVQGDSALGHFLKHRSSGCVAPSPVFYSARRSCPHGTDVFAPLIIEMRNRNGCYLPNVSCIGSVGLFDTNFYLIHGTDVLESSLDPVEHFCRFGWREGRNPNLYFDTNWYLATNPDVAGSDVNPLSHYAIEGESRGCHPTPYFDPPWYRQTYGLEAGQNALAHFLAHRRSQRYSPTPLFDVQWYMSQCGDLIGPDRDPFAHYLQFGTINDLNPSPEFDAAEYRKRHLGRISRAFPQLMHPHAQNPLVHYLRCSLARAAGSEAL